MICRQRFAIALTLALASFTGTASAEAQEWFKSFRTFSVYAENDVLAKWQDDTTDESFTQGMRLTWEFAKWSDGLGKTHHWLSILSKLKPSRFKPAFGACTPPKDRSAGPCGLVSFGIGQTMYSPVNIITSDLQTTDQPFAGWLFATMALNVRDGRWQSGSEFVVGVIGPPSFARNTQSLAHWTWSQGAAKPAGWDNQLKGSIHGGLMQNYAWHALEYCKGGGECLGGSEEGRIFDLSPKGELIATTAMVRTSGGAVVRLGYRFPDSLGQRIPATGAVASRSTERTNWWFAFFGAYDWRSVWHNAFLSGSYADGGEGGWRNIGQIVPRRGINERSAGVTVGNHAFTISVQGVSRSLEWDPLAITAQPKADPRARHSYVSVMLGLNATPATR